MAVFAYSTSRGVSATIEAPDRAAAVRELVRQGHTPTTVEAVHAGTAARRTPSLRRSMTKSE
ncbi:MAG: hypothetical protein KDA28_09855, partial [Phycisphaerales bacterium]|nr:hypothetical protein [Phycisphaerales bacterium]